MQRRQIGLWVYYLVAAVVFVIDYISKKLIEHNLELNEQVKVIGNFFYITFIHNRGAAFGILQEQRWFFLVITVAVVTAIVIYLGRSHRNNRRLMLAALALILGGALGNFLERAIYGQVVDFLQFNFGSYTFPIFNLADSAIVVGVCLIILDSLLTPTQTQENKNEQQKESSEQQPV
ncbi:signal peptidase II [Cohnella sp. 56]|uniref:signal peptidase II n=1 Tax=Cohnella sp. 56 TaxID=3113722 RepID=UPI0030EA5919